MPPLTPPAESRLEDLVRRVLGRAMAERGRERHPTAASAGPRAAGVQVEIRPSPGPDRPGAESDATADAGRRPGPELVTAGCLVDTPDGGVFAMPRGARVTPLAREEAFRRGIRLVSGKVPRAGEGEPLRVAVGSDHGGYAMKLEVLEWVRECGHRAVDLGCHDENAVDYPDFAHAVAQAVAERRCDVGILVDGAGIGSAMAANKVPGIRAANCWDERTAKNAREHNYANVLTLGGRLLDTATAHTVVRTFLATPFGAERHGRRVEKIHAIERRYK
ncbi:MAG: RpiB/LacA/LacB family sugar-phosphate isomerase [Planctomycetota bacterium]|nr:RpiB/LacA/LacB family sugar-phosphate isomerase [Planctomycetota bacterium]